MLNYICNEELFFGTDIAQTYLSLRQWNFRQWLPFSWTTLRDKYCRHPIAAMGVVDTFGHFAVSQKRYGQKL